MILRYIRRRRAARELEAATREVATLKDQIQSRRKQHKAWVPLLGRLVEAQHQKLRAETELGRW